MWMSSPENRFSAPLTNMIQGQAGQVSQNHWQQRISLRIAMYHFLWFGPRCGAAKPILTSVIFLTMGHHRPTSDTASTVLRCDLFQWMSWNQKGMGNIRPYSMGSEAAKQAMTRITIGSPLIQTYMLNLGTDRFPVNTGAGKTFGLDQRTPESGVVNINFTICLGA